MKQINVTKSFLPPIEEYVEAISKIWDTNWLTNYGPISIELENKLKDRFNIENLHYVNNGTTAIELALKAITDTTDCEIITTPFSFIATSSSIVWTNNKPIFVDIETKNFNVDINLIESKITNKTKAMLFVHCFGFPCDVEAIEKIAKKHNLYVIYDAAHCFDVKYKNKSLLSYGDISTCSFHATKVFHTVEGGLVAANNSKFQQKINAIKNFGNDDGNYNYIGTNAKNSEFHAAMGICVLNHIDEIKKQRKCIYDFYCKNLNDVVYIPTIPEECEYNYIYFPVLFKNENELLNVFNALSQNLINARRYFYPSLNKLDIFDDKGAYKISEDIASRILCLPIDSYLDINSAELICKIIKENIN